MRFRVDGKKYNGLGYKVLGAMDSCDKSQTVSCGLDKMVFLWDVSSGNVARKWRDTWQPSTEVAISGSVDKSVKIWESRSKSQDPVQTLEECEDNVTSLDISGDIEVRRYDLTNVQLATD